MTPSPTRSARRATRRWAVMLSALVVALLGVTAPATAVDPTGAFAGRVTDAGGAGVPGVFVTPFDSEGNAVADGATTDEDGFYQVDGVPVGDWIVQFWGWAGGYVDQYYDGAYSLNEAMGVPVVAGEVTYGVGAVMVLGGGVFGYVTAPNGDPVAGAEVFLYGSDNTHSVDTDEFGYYEFGVVRPGEYTLLFDGTGVGLVPEYYDDAFDRGSATPITIESGPAMGPISAQLGLPGGIAGRVTGPTGAGLADVVVTALGTNGETGMTTTTASDGSYLVEGLVPGGYTVSFDGSDQGWAIQYWDGVYDWELAAPVWVDLAETTVGIDASLTSGGTITGTVRGPSGQPVEGLFVSAWPAGSASTYTGVTNASGVYRITGVPAGTYTVHFDGSDHDLASEYFDDATTWFDAEEISLIGGQTRSGIDATLAAAGAVSGTVTGPDGGPVADVYVSVTGSGGTVDGALTGPDGAYEVPGLRAGTYTVYFDATNPGLVSEYFDDALRYTDADPVTVAGGQTTADIDAALAGGGSISGTVTGPDGPVDGVFVQVTDGALWFSASTALDGTYTVTGLPAGSYVVQFDADELGLVTEYYDDVLDVDDATPVAVEVGEDHAGIDAVLAPGATITGVVTGPGGAPAEGVWVSAINLSTDVTEAFDDTAADGTYTLIGLPAGSYVVRFMGVSAGLVSEYYDDVLEADAADPVTVGGGATVSGIDAQLGTGGSISGTVTGPDGPVADVWVSATGLDGVGQGAAFTAADGTYTMTGLAPDDYQVAFMPAGEELRSEYFDDQLSARSATVVTIAGTEALTGLDAVLASSSVPLFSDVPMNHPFVDEVEWLAVSGVTTGYPDGSFHPSASVERQAMAAFLYRFAGEPDFTPPATPSFTDVPRSHPFFTEIEWLADTGITTGWPDGTFRPMASVERQAMAAFLYRYAGEPAFTDPATASFTDVPKSSPFFTEVEWLASTRITTGWPDRTFRPGNQVERQAMAAFLMRFDQWLWA